MAFTPTKNIDVLVASHEIAMKRRAEGKPSWNRNLRIKQFFTDDEGDDAVKQIGKKVAAEIRRSLPAAWLEIGGDDYERDLDECVERFDDVTSSDDEETSLDNFNSTLEELYDWADIKRVRIV